MAKKTEEEKLLEILDKLKKAKVLISQKDNERLQKIFNSLFIENTTELNKGEEFFRSSRKFDRLYNKLTKQNKFIKDIVSGPKIEVSDKESCNFLITKEYLELLKEGIEKNQLPFVSKEKLISANSIVDNSGECLSSINLIYAQLLKNKHGYESNCVLSEKNIESQHINLKPGTKGFYCRKEIDGTVYTAKYYFLEQLENADKEELKAAALISKKDKSILNITSPDLAEYLSVYIAASRMNARVFVEPDVQNQFLNKLTAEVRQNLKEIRKNPSEIVSLNIIVSKANQNSVNIMSNSKKYLNTNEMNKERNMTYSISRGMER